MTEPPYCKSANRWYQLYGDKQTDKICVQGLSDTPFYLIQSNGANKCFVASFQDKEKIKSFLLIFIDNAEDGLQIKIHDFDDHENLVEFSGQEVQFSE